MADRTVGVGSLVDAHAAGISTCGITCSLVVVILASGTYCKDIGLVVNCCIGFLAGKGGFLEDGNLLLCNGLGSLHGLNDVNTILGAQDHGLADSSAEDGLEAGDNGILGHPAKVTLLSVIGITLIC